jgi:hypothetical protein
MGDSQIVIESLSPGWLVRYAGTNDGWTFASEADAERAAGMLQDGYRAGVEAGTQRAVELVDAERREWVSFSEPAHRLGNLLAALRAPADGKTVVTDGKCDGSHADCCPVCKVIRDEIVREHDDAPADGGEEG